MGWSDDKHCTYGATYVAGAKPYGKVDLTLTASVQWAIVRAGIAATVVLINAGFPAYGRVSKTGGSITTWPKCGSLEFEISAFSGNLKIFVESWTIGYGRRRRWIGFYSKWARWFEYTILNWHGLYKGWQLYAGSFCKWGNLQGLNHRHHKHHPHRHHPHRHHPHRHHPHRHSRRRRWWRL